MPNIAVGLGKIASKNVGQKLNEKLNVRGFLVHKMKRDDGISPKPSLSHVYKPSPKSRRARPNLEIYRSPSKSPRKPGPGSRVPRHRSPSPSPSPGPPPISYICEVRK